MLAEHLQPVLVVRQRRLPDQLEAGGQLHAVQGDALAVQQPLDEVAERAVAHGGALGQKPDG